MNWAQGTGAGRWAGLGFGKRLDTGSVQPGSGPGEPNRFGEYI